MSVLDSSLAPFASVADFGDMVASVDVDDAVIAALKRWMPTYLMAVRDARGLDYDLAVPADSNYANVIEDDEWKDHSLPAVLVATAKTQGAPQRGGEGDYSADWLVAVSCVVRGPDAAQTRRLASYFDLAVRLIMVQQVAANDPDSAVQHVRWVGGGEARPLVDPLGQNRWLGEGASQFVVATDGVMDDGAGPLIPDAYPYRPLPQVAVVTFNNEQVDPDD